MTTTFSVPYKVDKEYYHSVCIVEFFWFIGSLFALVATALKVFKLKEPIDDFAEEQQQQVAPKKDSASQSQSQGADKSKENQKSEDKGESNEDQLREDSESQNQQQQQNQQENIQNNDINLEIKQVPSKQPNPVTTTQTNFPVLRNFIKAIDLILDKHFIFMFIIIYMIISEGCYAYTAFCMMILVIMIILFDLSEVKPFNNIMKCFGDIDAQRILHHFWILSLFVGYFIYNQKFDDGLFVS